MQVSRGLALLDIVRELLPCGPRPACAPLPSGRALVLSAVPGRRYVFQVDMPEATRTALVDNMADCEHRLAFATSERLQLGSLVGAFCLARQDILPSP